MTLSFKFFVSTLAIIAIVTGCVDFILGLSAQQLLGANLSADAYADPLLNSQIRFLACVWLGFGMFLIFCLRDIERNFAVLRFALAILFLGGIGRLISLLQFGFPSTSVGIGFIVFALIVEIIVIPVFLLSSSGYFTKRA